MITEYEEIEISAWRQRGLMIIPIQAVSLKMDLVIVFIKQKKGRKNMKKNIMQYNNVDIFTLH